MVEPTRLREMPDDDATGSSQAPGQGSSQPAKPPVATVSPSRMSRTASCVLTILPLVFERVVGTILELAIVDRLGSVWRSHERMGLGPQLWPAKRRMEMIDVTEFRIGADKSCAGN